ncbi:MAG: hypothetical protein LC753_05235 [Acidobacteria bacterium]|nr:hypothetical protein [Acidobacteriota bacterium]MCA1649696.1 hypothetical protein [Acidobacteriota bacterium]
MSARTVTSGTTNDGVNDPRLDGLGSLVGQDSGVDSRHRWFTDCDTGTDSDGGKERRLDDASAAKCCDRNA